MVDIREKDDKQSIERLERELSKAYADYEKLKKTTISVSRRLDNAIERIKQLT